MPIRVTRRLLTVEVNRNRRALVQVRGKCNQTAQSLRATNRRAGLACGVTDFLWACAQTKFMYGGSITSLWQGVASVPFGQSMLHRRHGALIGVGLHFVTAFTWAAVFVFVLSRLTFVQKTLASRASIRRLIRFA